MSPNNSPHELTKARSAACGGVSPAVFGTRLCLGSRSTLWFFRPSWPAEHRRLRRVARTSPTPSAAGLPLRAGEVPSQVRTFSGNPRSRTSRWRRAPPPISWRLPFRLAEARHRENLKLSARSGRGDNPGQFPSILSGPSSSPASMETATDRARCRMTEIVVEDSERRQGMGTEAALRDTALSETFFSLLPAPAGGDSRVGPGAPDAVFGVGRARWVRRVQCSPRRPSGTRLGSPLRFAPGLKPSPRWRAPSAGPAGRTYLDPSLGRQPN